MTSDTPRTPNTAPSASAVEQDLTASLGDFDPVVAPPDLPATDVSYVVDDTAIGRMLLACNQFGAMVASVFVPDDTAEDSALERIADHVSPRILRRPAALDAAREELTAYLSGGRRAFGLHLDLALATPFQRKVLTTLARSVPYGERSTYGQLAGLMDRPGAARAVGTALGNNPLCVLLPCHRVVAGSGALSGYAGGPAAKEYLLTLESRATQYRVGPQSTS